MYTPVISVICLVAICELFAAEDLQKNIYEESFVVENALYLRFDVDVADLRLHKNHKNECKIVIEYDKRYCAVQVKREIKRQELSVMVDHDNIEMLKNRKANKSHYAIIRIDLPYRARMDIEASINAGKIVMQLGDLNLGHFLLTSWAGEVLLDFDEPNRREIDRLEIDVKLGSMKISRLGNARFKEARISSELGQMMVDFSGIKMPRSRAKIDLKIGKIKLLIPKEVGVKMKVSKFLFLSAIDCPRWFVKKGSYYYSRNDDEENTFFLSVLSGIGKLSVEVAK